MALSGEPATTRIRERALVQCTAWVLVLLILGMDFFRLEWKVLALAAGLIILGSIGVAARLENVNLVGVLEKIGVWIALIAVVVVVEVGVHARWDFDAVTGREIMAATGLVMIGDFVAEIRDHVSERVTSHQHRDVIRDSVSAIAFMIKAPLRWCGGPKKPVRHQHAGSSGAQGRAAELQGAVLPPAGQDRTDHSGKGVN